MCHTDIGCGKFGGSWIGSAQSTIPVCVCVCVCYVCVCIACDLSNIRVTFKIKSLVKCLAKHRESGILAAIRVGFCQFRERGWRKHVETL